ncbi:MAG: hypothetical protein C4525_03715 [Desulfarculus sp.]|nr:MAG: hypothetical protein C4525_03715 [Desulfarculus sp.]
MRRATLICLAAALLMAGCGGFYAPAGEHPARLVLQAAGRISRADIDQAVADKIGPLRDQPTLDHWLGPPTWQVEAVLLGAAGAVWRLEPLGGLARPEVGLAAEGQAEFLAPAGPGRYRLVFSCVVTHYWSEGLRTYQEPVYVRLWVRELELTLPAGGRLELAPFSGPGRP